MQRWRLLEFTVPHLEPAPISATRQASIPIGVEGVATSRRRIFIHSRQHSHMADIGMDTSTGGLISSLETEGVLDGWAGIGG